MVVICLHLAVFATRCTAGPKITNRIGTASPAVSTASTEPDQPVPDLSFEELVYDFGIAGPNQKIHHTFAFTNTGTDPLQIGKIAAGCGCTAILLSASTIPPNGHGAIRATFETRQYTGEQEEIISVHSNDPDAPVIKLTMRGLIKTDVAVDPSGLHFGDIAQGKAANGHIRLLQLSNSTLILYRIEANDTFLAVAPSRFREENGRGIRLDITLKPVAPVGVFSEIITLHTNLKKHPRIDIPVWANIH